ncbi:MAG: hypothetical protein OEY93_04625 [Anaerolineae bacterium]|nr:hypothetical protein [Anaerolineae bacterium]
MIESTDYQIIPKKRPVFTNWLNIILTIAFFGVFIFAMAYDEFFDDIFISAAAILFVLGAILNSLLEGYIFRMRWQALADQTGLEYYPQSRSIFKQPSLMGNRHGYVTKLATFTRGSGKSRRHYTRFSFILPFENAESFSIKKRSLLDGRDVKIGMEDVDKTFTIRASTPHMVHRIFQSNRLRQSLFDLVRQSKKMNLEVTANELIFTEPNRIMDVEYLAALHDFLHKICESVKLSSAMQEGRSQEMASEKNPG